MKGISNEIYTSGSNLKMLRLSNCGLTPTSVAFLWRLENLEYLNLGNDKYINNNHVGNIFWDIPISELKNSCRLQVLIVCGVGLATVPQDIIQLSGLQYLDLCSNDLVWLPDVFCDLVTLVSCRLSDNSLSALPAQLGNLIALKELILDGNKVCYTGCGKITSLFIWQ
jgi:Leucine-rich repeat (LRR) protein